MPKIVIMAGGTGGHVFPGIAVADELVKRGWIIDWFGTADRMEAQTVPKAGYRIHFLKVSGVRGKGIVKKLSAPIVIAKAVFESIRLLKKIQPDVVLGMGGYASGPGGLAAKLLGIPLIVHEQNAVFGMTNRYLAKLTPHVLCGFDVLNSSFAQRSPAHVRFVGNPVRQGFINDISPDNTSSATVKSDSSLVSDKINILVLGGSLGAQALNECVPTVIAQFDTATKQKLKIVHQAGKEKAALPLTLYTDDIDVEVHEFIDDMPQVMKQADIIICRAGALTVAEIACCGKTAIFVPLPIAVDDHQTYNALSLSENDAAFLIPQQSLIEKLPDTLQQLIENPREIEKMAHNSRLCGNHSTAQLVADVCAQSIGQ